MNKDKIALQPMNAKEISISAKEYKMKLRQTLEYCMLTFQ